ncbi:HAMP domain-containing histidine kinase [Candidatus Kaiserbacteria bacterium]|nr:HAMP domain-containing histidine kinase [Candidatus Kaiserbacteria bacterium]
MDRESRRLKKLVWIGSAGAVAAIAIAIAASWILYQETINLLTENLRERLLSISITQAANIDADDLAALHVEADWKKPEWGKVVTQLKKAKDSNPNIVFMYIIRKLQDDPTQMEFVADAESIYPYANSDADPTNDVDANKDGVVEPDGADYLQWPGQPNPDPADHIPEAFEAYRGPITVAELYEDSYGRVLTGYAPITDDAGNVAAILATDIKAEDFLTVTRQTLFPFLIFIFFLTFVIAVLAFTLIYIWAQRAEMLAKLSHRLEIANKQQESLLHFISHEVKGYLTESQAGFAAIVEGDFGTVSDKLGEMARGALSSMRRGVATVMDLLDASNFKKGTMAFVKKEFDLRKAVREVVEELQPSAEEKGLKIDLAIGEGAYMFVGDEDKIRRHVIRNLIDNAIKYTPRGTVKVELTDGEKLHFTVKDSGVGITSEDMRNLFTAGGHGKNAIKINVHSTGYGLFIAKEVVEAQGGRIWAESKGEGTGSAFVVEFPLLRS